MKVYILRHGETKLNKIGGHFQGQINTPMSDLDENGVREARAAGETFRKRGIHFDVIYTSPQKRAMDTAELVTGRSRDEMMKDDRLMEQDFGPFEGEPWEKMDPKLFYALMHDAAHYYPGPGMESIYHLIQRAGNFLDDLAVKKPGESILVSTHGGTVRGMLCHLHAGSIDDFWGMPVRNCAWYELTLQNGKFVITDRNPGAGDCAV